MAERKGAGRKIQGNAKTVRELLKGVKYTIDYYQREYKWQEKQVRELIDDLSDKFLEEYKSEHLRRKVAEYPHYFLGSIIISEKDGKKYIVDGQQRLTSLTLLLILLRNLQQDLSWGVNVDELVFSEKYGDKSFNLDIDERKQVMEALFDREPFDPTGSSESVQNLFQRYHDLEENLPQELQKDTLPYFIDWLLENVHLVEITAFSDEDAYTIFETMNDRGLSLSPTDMLKGYLLANIEDQAKRTAANDRWRKRILELNEAGKEVEPDFFKAWLRSQYAQRMRERKKGAKPEDFDRIGTEYHRWLKDVHEEIGLHNENDFYRFINRDLEFYSKQYLRLIDVSQRMFPGLEHVFYNANQGFTLQNMLLLAPVKPEDSEDVVIQKVRLVAKYLDILLARRFWNFRSTAYSTILNAMFVAMRDIRGLEPEPLAEKLRELLDAEETFASNDRFYLLPQNKNAIHRLLARLTDYVEVESGNPSRYSDYMNVSGRNRFEIEHIWANQFKHHANDFSHQTDFEEYRNRIGGLLLLPKKIRASCRELRYEKKLPNYNSQNLLTWSLGPECYDQNPGFLDFVKRTELPFKPYDHFTRADLDERGNLYKLLAERVWNPDDLGAEI